MFHCFDFRILLAAASLACAFIPKISFAEDCTEAEELKNGKCVCKSGFVRADLRSIGGKQDDCAAAGSGFENKAFSSASSASSTSSSAAKSSANCMGGMVRTEDGKGCKCPEGQEMIGARCKVPKAQAQNDNNQAAAQDQKQNDKKDAKTAAKAQQKSDDRKNDKKAGGGAKQDAKGQAGENADQGKATEQGKVAGQSENAGQSWVTGQGGTGDEKNTEVAALGNEAGAKSSDQGGNVKGSESDAKNQNAGGGEASENGLSGSSVAETEAEQKFLADFDELTRQFNEKLLELQSAE